MTSLSTPRDRSTRLGDLAIGLGVPLAVAVLFIAVLLGEEGQIEHDLQLIAPSAAEAGGEVALRAYILAGLTRPEGPELLTVPVSVRLIDGDGREQARTRLRPSAVRGLEGTLAVPARARGDLVLEGRADLGDGIVARVKRRLVVAGRGRPLAVRGRLLPPMQQYVQYPVRSMGGEPPPALEVRVTDGACVPELPCELLVRVGEPAAAVRIDASPAVEPVADHAASAGETSGIARLRLVVHGPEAVATIIASRAGADVAAREVRLPVVLGAVALEPGPAVQRGPRPRLRFAGPERVEAVIVDGFREARWERTGSAAVEPAADLALPFRPLTPGIWRLQVRAEAFAPDDAAARVIVVADRGATDDAVVAEAIRFSRAARLDDPFAEVAARAGELPVEDRVAFLLAPAALDLVAEPTAIGSRSQLAAGDDEVRDRRRLVAGGAIVLGGLLVVLLVLRRGLRASAEARRLLAEAGDERAFSGRRRLAMTLDVVALAAVVLLTFLATGALLLSRGAW